MRLTCGCVLGRDEPTLGFPTSFPNTTWHAMSGSRPLDPGSYLNSFDVSRYAAHGSAGISAVELIEASQAILSQVRWGVCCSALGISVSWLAEITVSPLEQHTLSPRLLIQLNKERRKELDATSFSEGFAAWKLSPPMCVIGSFHVSLVTIADRAIVRSCLIPRSSFNACRSE
jgi:hypothetical protein